MLHHSTNCWYELIDRFNQTHYWLKWLIWTTENGSFKGALRGPRSAICGSSSSSLQCTLMIIWIPDFERSVLGCTEADFWNQMLPNIHFAAFLNICETCTLLHRPDSIVYEISAKDKWIRWSFSNSERFREFLQNWLKFENSARWFCRSLISNNAADWLFHVFLQIGSDTAENGLNFVAEEGFNLAYYVEIFYLPGVATSVAAGSTAFCVLVDFGTAFRLDSTGIARRAPDPVYW